MERRKYKKKVNWFRGKDKFGFGNIELEELDLEFYREVRRNNDMGLRRCQLWNQSHRNSCHWRKRVLCG
jgi:hypothetical protein